MSVINDGGPAFPRMATLSSMNHGDYDAVYEAEGITVRDWFAGQALAGMCARDLSGNSIGNDHINHARVRGLVDARIASAAYELADAMIAAREGKK